MAAAGGAERHGAGHILDKDIVLYCISKLVLDLNRGLDITPTVELSAHEVMVGTNRRTTAASYRRFEDALIRLRGTTIVTDIETGNCIQTRGFGRSTRSRSTARARRRSSRLSGA